jgi:diaminopimelate decarboxylase
MGMSSKSLRGFGYRNGALHAEQVDLAGLAAEVGTPFFCYSSEALEAGYRAFTAALEGLPARVFYALKANSNQAVIATFARLGAGADVVSEGEMRRALAAGVPPDAIVFAGVGKTPAEMAAALDVGILQFNVESLPELETLSRVAQHRQQMATVALRVNPDVDARTHRHITTGTAENKFGIDFDQAHDIARRAADFPGITIKGLAVHIGSQLTSIGPYQAALERLVALYRELRSLGLPLSRLDFGGGLGITYKDEVPVSMEAYAKVVREVTKGLDAELAFEPGRSLVGNAGLMVTRVLYVKETASRRFLVIDAAMNDLLRPMLYDAWHDIEPLRAPVAGSERKAVDIVGPVCESTDTFARQREMPPVQAGDLLAIFSTGAYSAVMGSTYNSRLLAPEVLVQGERVAIVRPRGSYEELIAQDRLPDWLAAQGGLARQA